MADGELGKLEQHETAAQVVWAAFTDFSNVLDFIWKLPSFVEQQFRVEFKKLHAYFPKPSPERDLRWKLESQKIGSTFPFLIATGSLFAVLALFEIYLLRVAAILLDCPMQVIVGEGGGVRKTLDRLPDVGINPKVVSFWPQVDAAIRIRNCLIHAHGFLDHSRRSERLRALIEQELYVTPGHRGKRIGDDMLVRIVATPFGERVQVTHMYAWIVGVYCRDYLFSLIEMAGQLPEGVAEFLHRSDEVPRH